MFRLRPNRENGDLTITAVDTHEGKGAMPAWTAEVHFRKHLYHRVKQAANARKNGEKHLFPEGSEVVTYKLVEVSRESIDAEVTASMLRLQSENSRR